MKRIYIIYSRLHLSLKLFLVCGVWFFLTYMLLRTLQTGLPVETQVLISIVLGGVVGAMLVLLMEMFEKSLLFWRAAEEFENKLMSIDNKRELEEFFASEFHRLKRKAFGRPHFSEMQRLWSVANVLHKKI